MGYSNASNSYRGKKLIMFLPPGRARQLASGIHTNNMPANTTMRNRSSI